MGSIYPYFQNLCASAILGLDDRMVQTKGNPLIGKLSVDVTEGVSVALGKQKCQKIKGFSWIHVWIYAWIYARKNEAYIQKNGIKKQMYRNNMQKPFMN